jgi:NTP-dependent ternary system trypsin peptidase co-occuring protein
VPQLVEFPLVGKADETVEAAFARVKPAAVALVTALRDLVDAPDEIQVTFGIRLSGEVGAVIAKTSADANFEVQMSWKAKEA